MPASDVMEYREMMWKDKSETHFLSLWVIGKIMMRSAVKKNISQL